MKRNDEIRIVQRYTPILRKPSIAHIVGISDIMDDDKSWWERMKMKWRIWRYKRSDEFIKRQETKKKDR